MGRRLISIDDLRLFKTAYEDGTRRMTVGELAAEQRSDPSRARMDIHTVERYMRQLRDRSFRFPLVLKTVIDRGDRLLSDGQHRSVAIVRMVDEEAGYKISSGDVLLQEP
jgi:hypothetical protein